MMSVKSLSRVPPPSRKARDFGWWREQLSEITRKVGPRPALDAAAEWLAALDADLERARTGTPKPGPPRADAGRKRPKHRFKPARKAGAPVPGKTRGREGQALSLFLAGISLDAIGAEMGCTGEAIRLLAKRKGWKR